MITLFSSNGELAVEPVTGLVIKADSHYYASGHDEATGLHCLGGIQRIDIEEFCVFWGCEPMDGDILDFGYWYDAPAGSGDGYEPPAMDWRLDTVIPMLLDDAAYYGVLDQVGADTTPGELLELVNKGRAFGAIPKNPELRTTPTTGNATPTLIGDGETQEGKQQ